MRTWGIAGELLTQLGQLKKISQRSGRGVGAWMERAGVKQVIAIKIIATCARKTKAAD